MASLKIGWHTNDYPRDWWAKHTDLMEVAGRDSLVQHALAWIHQAIFEAKVDPFEVEILLQEGSSLPFDDECKAVNIVICADRPVLEHLVRDTDLVQDFFDEDEEEDVLALIRDE